jgi:hypothetical protein
VRVCGPLSGVDARAVSRVLRWCEYSGRLTALEVESMVRDKLNVAQEYRITLRVRKPIAASGGT